MKYFFLILFLLPLNIQAQVVITEVMYDPAGSDTGREWIEVQNVSGETIDFTTWKFFEANVNHGIDQIEGYAKELSAGEYGVIVSDKTKFLLDFPSFYGKMFKSSFSFNNTGESVAFKRESSGPVIDEYLYDVALGAAGDGNSLQKNTSSWLVALPTPGLITTGATGTTGGQTDGVATSTATSTQSTATTTQSGGITINSSGTTVPTTTGSGSKFIIPQVFGAIVSPQIILAGVDTEFQAEAFTKDGKDVANSQFVWNFGDGSTASGKKVFHRFKYPGIHSVVMETNVAFGASNSVATEYGLVTVVAPSFSLREEKDQENQTYIAIKNETEYKVDVSSWVIYRKGILEERFAFQKNTFIEPLTEIRIPQEVTQFKNDQALRSLELIFPNGKVVAKYDPAYSNTIPKLAVSVPQNVPQGITETAHTNIAPTSKPAAVVLKKPTTHVVASAENQGRTDLQNTASTTTATPTPQVATLGIAPESQTGTSVIWYVLPLLAIAILSSFFLGKKKEESILVDYTIIEDGK